MQDNFFETWLGQWPTTIDWTGAVIGTHVAATLNVLSSSRSSQPQASQHVESVRLQEFVNGYFAQITAYYFGENAFAIRTQAHDDMLWVVLGWLESLRLIDSYSELHLDMSAAARPAANGTRTPAWHGSLFAPAFAHRSRVFYDIVAKAWDRELCGGGVTWNPRLRPYKNTVTNTQLISAAVGMYLFHPGDAIEAPFMDLADGIYPSNNGSHVPSTRPHNLANLALAKEAYDWLRKINMTNAQGLYADGYHATRRRINGSIVHGSCSLRDESVYSYNQGVILSGQRQLWEATGNISYLWDGHALVRAVINATGFPARDGRWAGLGYAGLLTEACDARSACGQDAQTFKGIFFHHLAVLCERLPVGEALARGKTFTATHAEASLHAASCRSYIPFVERNARAAWHTRDRRGIMGSWWGADRGNGSADVPLPVAWAGDRHSVQGWEARQDVSGGDSNDRGRGRTVEAHSGGLAVLRALYALRVRYE